MSHGTEARTQSSEASSFDQRPDNRSRTVYAPSPVINEE